MNMQRQKIQIIETNDGSHTLSNSYCGDSYHSVFGAITEAEHIFIRHGLQTIEKSHIHIFEMGFGTGLNALLSLLYALRSKKTIYYHTIEKFPLDNTIIDQLNYPSLLGENAVRYYALLHSLPWNEEYCVEEYFYFKKNYGCLLEHSFIDDYYDGVFYDAFSPDKDPALWSEDIFQRLSVSMHEGAVLCTYSCKGIVKRALRAAGMKVQRVAGPPGKREILIAKKITD